MMTSLIRLFLFSGLIVTAGSGPALAEVIYGEDNRRDVYTEKSEVIKTMALSTAALIQDSNLEELGSTVRIRGRSLGDMYQLCEDQKFRQQPTAAHCSGTLVAPDIIMTAGHCYDTGNNECKNNAWVFDFKVTKENQGSVSVPQTSVYRCQEILKVINDPFKKGDFALIRLDRPVSDRSPIKLSKKTVRINDPLVLIGHPLGLPTKIADGGNVLRIDKNFFLSNLDAFSINSGSGVFNASTEEVVGILSSGAKDHESQNGCTVARVLNSTEGQEKVMKLDQVRDHLLKL